MQLTYSIYYPGGNTTALVNQLILNPALKKRINDKIMTENPFVEQVGFIDPKNYRLEMAGGEFCGNATRCAAFYYLNGLPGKIKLKVSGVTKKLVAGINTDKTVWAQTPFLVNPVSRKLGYTIIKLQGITQVITKSSASKLKAKQILKKLGLLNSDPAAGVMFINKNKSVVKLDPFVWVRDIRTFFNETACASGTAAVGMYLTNKLKKSINLPILQPSKEIINVSIKYKQSKFSEVLINGQIKLLKNNLTLKV